ncbi:hypothetical protein [Bacillus wiedmannii]|uniref:Uncharacterized protein n=1 Tax=Bacillus wiedmannii TaxID=1890302 RepID=A0A2A7W246_9BACI|nr:hypothetical protein [Bacillus wiedmannii]PEJ09102.1 hypothetical protein CN684_07570 [Bacillus wiedmannii]PHC72560.1 hypothetical protein COF35_01905 [Bacillus wiedmannii]
MYVEKDFWIPNISNIPNDREKLRQIINLFELNKFSLHEMYYLDFHNQINLSKETFRKRINHSTLIGILNYNDQKYELSEVSKKLFLNEINLNDYIKRIITQNTTLYKITCITFVLTTLFAPSLRLKTLYSIFALVGKDRKDSSAISTTGRNLRPILSLMRMIGIIEKRNDEIVLGKQIPNSIIDIEVQPLCEHFNEDIVNIKLIKNYLNEYFDKETVDKILTCTSSYETKNFIWSKSSLYKNQGEVRNLFNEYIMTVIIKKGI